MELKESKAGREFSARDTLQSRLEHRIEPWSY